MNKIIIGETCLLDKQLRRGGIIDSAHGCFDNVLVNLEGIEKIIDDDFLYVLDREHMSHESYMYYPKHNISHTKWLNKKYSSNIDGIYSWDVMSFFHLDKIEDWESCARKIERTKQWFEDSLPTTLYYYHRPHDNYNIVKHMDKLIKFMAHISKKYNKTIKCVNVTNQLGSPSVIETIINDSIITYDIASQNSWIGIDDNWDAHLDNTLFDAMFNSDNFKLYSHI